MPDHKIQNPLNTSEAIFRAIQSRRSFLCVGLDPDVQKMPGHLSRSPEGILTFLKEIIEATSEFCVAFKPNFAFFESFGSEGYALLEEVIRFIPQEHLVIGDAKRGDIGNTAAQYAKAGFTGLGCDALTVSPYMGVDTLQPFLAYEDKWTIVLILTSNPGSADFQQKTLSNGHKLWEEVLSSCVNNDHSARMMFVIGATHPEDFKLVRKHVPDHFLLVPGFGAQNGSLESVANMGFNQHCGILANVSRGILYASSGHDFGLAATKVAAQYRDEMADLLASHGLLPQ
jgi:orotidine-5'-phosphate decarboxylase